MRSTVLLVFLLAGCGSRELPPLNLPPFPSASAAGSERPAPGTIWEEEVDAAVVAGLGHFLQQVSIREVLEAGRFVGWEILALSPRWSDVDLRVGDIVTSVNDLPIESDQQAFAAFQSLADAKRLEVSYVRDGEPRELVLQVVPRGGPAASPSKPGVAKSATPPPAPSGSAVPASVTSAVPAPAASAR